MENNWRSLGRLAGRLGEIQIWDVAKKTLVLSVPMTYDTLYGVSWSPDGTSPSAFELG